MSKYRQVGIICKAKLNEEGTNCVLDLPFRVFHQECVSEGVNYGCYPLPKKLDGKEVFAVVSYSTTDTEVYDPINRIMVKTVENATPKVLEIDAKVVKDFQTDARVKAHWAVTKADFYATQEVVKDLDGKPVLVDGKEQTITTKYDGADKAELAPFCVSEVTMSKVDIKPIEELKEVVK